MSTVRSRSSWPISATAPGSRCPRTRRSDCWPPEPSARGLATLEYLAAAIPDQSWYTRPESDLPERPDQVEPFEARALTEAGIAHPQVPPRCRSCYVNHTSGGGCDAYIWSEGPDADTVEWFQTVAAGDGDGGLNRAAGDTFRSTLLARGHSQDPMLSYRQLRGRDPQIQPLLNRRGLARTQHEESHQA